MFLWRKQSQIRIAFVYSVIWLVQNHLKRNMVFPLLYGGNM